MAWVYFPETCVISMIASTAGGRQAEVGLIGCEGTNGIGEILGGPATQLESLVQATGNALQLPARILESALVSNPDFKAVLLRFVHSFVIQVSSSALAFATFPVAARLARWLLMMQDRVRGDELMITHETLATMLGVRRAGVTLALQDVERRGLIAKRRGTIIVIDRGGLEALAADSYGVPEEELLRTLDIDLRWRSA